MPYGSGSEAEIKQRQEAALKHGAYSKQVTPARRGRMAELEEQASGRAGLLELLQDRCLRAVMMCEIIESYIVEQKNSGVSLEDMPVLRALPAFMNTAQRCIASLLNEMPGEQAGASEELKHILEVIDEHDKQSK